MKKRLAIAGCGHLGGIIAGAYAAGLLEGYELVGAYNHTPEKAESIAQQTGCRACTTLEELLDCAPDYVAEAASVQLVKEIAVPVLCPLVRWLMQHSAVRLKPQPGKTVCRCTLHPARWAALMCCVPFP